MQVNISFVKNSSSTFSSFCVALIPYLESMIRIQTKLTIGMQTRQTLIKTYQWCIQSPMSCNNNITCSSIIVKCPLARKLLHTSFWLGNTIQVHTVSAGEHNPENGVLQMQENLWVASFLIRCRAVSRIWPLGEGLDEELEHSHFK